MGCYSDPRRVGTTHIEYPCLDDSVQYCNMYDTLLKKNVAKEKNLINPIEQNVTSIEQHNELMVSGES